MVRRRNRSEEGLGRENKVEALTVVQAGDDEGLGSGKDAGGWGKDAEGYRVPGTFQNNQEDSKRE